MKIIIIALFIGTVSSGQAPRPSNYYDSSDAEIIKPYQRGGSYELRVPCSPGGSEKWEREL